MFTRFSPCGPADDSSAWCLSIARENSIHPHFSCFPRRRLKLITRRANEAQYCTPRYLRHSPACPVVHALGVQKGTVSLPSTDTLTLLGSSPSAAPHCSPGSMLLLLSALLGLTPHSAEVGRRSVLLGGLAASAAPSPAVAAQQTQPPNYFMPAQLHNAAAPGATARAATAALAKASVFGVMTDGSDGADIVKMHPHRAFKSISTSRALYPSRARRLGSRRSHPPL